MTAKSQVNQSPLASYVTAMSGQVVISFARQLQHEDLSIAEFAAMHLLRIGPLRVSELGDSLNRPLPAASRIASALVDRGFVLREEDEADRRAKRLTLSKKGRTLLESHAGEVLASIGKTLAGMEGEIAAAQLQMFQGLVASETDGNKVPSASKK
jgi:DNA-binding MarR family transcriptional regulator